MLVSFLVSGSAGWANPASSAHAAADSSGILTEVKGNVYTRGFTDESKQLWGNPLPANKGDAVVDGMQVGTGDDSWTQCTFKHVTARAWENSVYMVSPKQKLVYLVGGELLFNLDKHRPDKSSYSVWTKYLHATVRGTTLLVQSTSDGSRISVLEGTIDVTNRVDQSVVTLTPGSVYEVKAKDEAKKTSVLPADYGVTDSAFISMSRTAQEDLGLAGTLNAFGGKVDLTASQPIDITLPSLDPIVLFDSLSTTVLGELTSLQQVLNHPLLSSFETPLASLPLIQQEMPALKSPMHLTQLQNATSLFKSLEVRQVPLTREYNIGSDTLGKLKDRQVAIQHWAPTGVVSWSRDAVGGPLSSINDNTSSLAGRGVVSSMSALNSVLGNRGGVVPVSLTGITSGLTGNLVRPGGANFSVSSIANQGGVRGSVGGGGGGGGSTSVPGGLGGTLGGILNGGGLGGLLK